MPDQDARSNGKRSRGRLRVWFRIRITRHLRAYFLAGILITAPIGITFYLAWLIISWIDTKVAAVIPLAYHPETYLPFAIPGIGLVVAIIALTLIGAMTAGLAGRLWTRTSEQMLARMPVIRGLYSAIKQIFETILAQKVGRFPPSGFVRVSKTRVVGARFHYRQDRGRGPEYDQRRGPQRVPADDPQPRPRATFYLSRERSWWSSE